MNRSLSLLTERIAAIPEHVRAARHDLRLDEDRAWDATGAGSSEGPARALIQLLVDRGSSARFVPLSTFALPDFTLPPAGVARGLVVFSQGLSPNARLALGRRSLYDRSLLVSARETPHADVLLSKHGPSSESDLLVRLIGPVLAALAALHLGGQLLDMNALADAIARASESAPRMALSGPVALVTAGDRSGLTHTLRWKLLESLGLRDPPVWDVLQVAHGPFQQFYDAPLTLVSLEHDADAPLFERLHSMLVPERHRLIRLRASLEAPLSWFEHDAMLNQLVIATLRDKPRDLVDWPGKGADHALYMLDEPITTAG